MAFIPGECLNGIHTVDLGECLKKHARVACSMIHTVDLAVSAEFVIKPFIVSFLWILVRLGNRTLCVNLVKNTASQCSAGSPCPAHCLNVAGLGGARRPGECQ